MATDEIPLVVFLPFIIALVCTVGVSLLGKVLSGDTRMTLPKGWRLSGGGNDQPRSNPNNTNNNNNPDPNGGRSRRTNHDGGHGTRKKVKIGLGIFTAVVVLGFMISASVKTVEAGHRGVLTHWNAVDQNVVLGEGLHFVTPLQDNVIQMEVRTQKVEAPAASASKDLQDVNTVITVNYHIDPATANNLYQQVGLDYNNRIISPAIQESTKQITAKFNAEELITRRETVKFQIEDTLGTRLREYGIILEAVSITEFKFSNLFTQAIEDKVTAQQRALQAENDLKRIEIEAQQVIARAEGEKQSAILKAEGQAQSIRIIDDQLRNSPYYLEYLKTQQWDGRLPLVIGEGGFPFIQIPITKDDIQQPN